MRAVAILLPAAVAAGCATASIAGRVAQTLGSAMLVIALDQGELEVVRLDGDIDRLLTAAIADDPSTGLGLADDE